MLVLVNPERKLLLILLTIFHAELVGIDGCGHRPLWVIVLEKNFTGVSPLETGPNLFAADPG